MVEKQACLNIRETQHHPFTALKNPLGFISFNPTYLTTRLIVMDGIKVGMRKKKSRRDAMIIEKKRNTSLNPEGVKYKGNNENISPLRD